MGLGATMRDTQADVPSTRWLRAQLAFKDSMIRGILQFTPSIAFRYVLHRCESRDIRCRESFSIHWKSVLQSDPRGRGGLRTSLRFDSLAQTAPGVRFLPGSVGVAQAPGIGLRGRMRRPPPAAC